ncbi:hypothetical protein PaG_04979 [Moesziomyces aphidis]|uniref:Uncharacterized protein n=1 Tax=Moesziomyces aphidis TaxID=84754 RepID=W3VJV8_MOEAP|nr:hypothetical protein PaG_04979 [Moesziomyces aphidis]
MQYYADHGAQGARSSYPSYPPVSASSPHYPHQQHHNNARRYSGESSRPPSQAGSSRPPYGQPPRSPLASLPAHGRDESDEYEERDLGEIAAANQAAQEQRWGPHAALSEAPGRFDAYHDPRHDDFHAPMPTMPVYESAHYDGGFYMEPPGLYEPAPQYRPAPSLGSPSIASSHTLGGRSRQSLPVYASPLMAPSASSPASEPPNMFNVTAAHHTPGGRPRPFDDPRAQSGARVGDPLPGFPNWSHTWYGGHLSADGHAYTMVPPGSGQSGWESETISHHRPGYPGPPGAYGPYPYGRTATHDQVKEERIRMLEKEFGPKVKHKGKGKGADDDDDDKDDDDDESEVVPIGGVNAKGRLVLPRRKTRITTRVLQCLVSLVAAGCGIGGFLAIHPQEKAPPSGTMPSFVLYGVSALSTIICLYLFTIKPCRSGRDAGGAPMGGGGAGNGMVIPIMAGGAGGKPGKGGMFGKKGKSAMQQGTTVNLIVDPSLLGQRADESDSETDEDETLPGEERRRKKRRAKKRQKLGMLGNMKLQARWRVARTSLKWDCAWDVVMCLLWGAAAVMALGVGKKCPSGTAEGWCTLYNSAIACAIVAALVGLVAIYCDIVGLRASRAPPKARV